MSQCASHQDQLQPTAPDKPLPPGPKPLLPMLGFLRVMRLGLLESLARMQAHFGDIVFFKAVGNRPFCLVSDPALIKQVLITDNARFTKTQALAQAKAALGEGLLTSEGPFHKKQRRMIAPVFHAQKVKAYADGFAAQAQAMADQWQAGQTIDLDEAMTELTLRVVTESLFGAELEEDLWPVGQDMSRIVQMFDRTRHPLGWLLNRLTFLPSNRQYFAAMQRLDDRIAGLIEARQQEQQKDPDAVAQRFDLLTLLLMARDEHAAAGDADKGMSAQQVRDEAVTLFMAGHETTANALVWTWLFLDAHPEAAAKLHEELNTVAPDGRALTAEDVTKLVWTRAVLSESMRLRPPAWVIGRECKEPYDLGPYRVPAGTAVLMSQHVVHRDERWWPEPEAFKPERWLQDPGDRPKHAYFPFGGGPRSCVGEPFAWMEAIVLLATLAQRWQLKRANNAPIQAKATITLRPKDAVPMVVQAW